MTSVQQSAQRLMAIGRLFKREHHVLSARQCDGKYQLKFDNGIWYTDRSGIAQAMVKLDVRNISFGSIKKPETIAKYFSDLLQGRIPSFRGVRVLKSAEITETPPKHPSIRVIASSHYSTDLWVTSFTRAVMRGKELLESSIATEADLQKAILDLRLYFIPFSTDLSRALSAVIDPTEYKTLIMELEEKLLPPIDLSA
ncbi:MAG: hypothetical protein WCV91_01790 [Candidatus Margulisiibacteriota bacterium]|jgi:hypothetical protein